MYIYLFFSLIIIAHFPHEMIGRLLSHDRSINSLIDPTILIIKKNYRPHCTKDRFS